MVCHVRNLVYQWVKMSLKSANALDKPRYIDRPPTHRNPSGGLNVSPSFRLRILKENYNLHYSKFLSICLQDYKADYIRVYEYMCTYIYLQYMYIATCVACAYQVLVLGILRETMRL